MAPEGKYFDNVTVVVIDGMGAGPAADTAENYPEDLNCNSLANATRDGKPLNSPGLQSMGISLIPGYEKLKVERPFELGNIRGAFGALEPTFAGNGSPEGHQSLAGLVTVEPYEIFNKTGIPAKLIEDIEATVSALLDLNVQVIRYPGTDDINGEKFIAHPDIGPVHFADKDLMSSRLRLPVYASSDSLVQIAIHQGVLPQETIEKIGLAVRKMLDDTGRRVARVIMRPFLGEPGNFKRVSADRRDYSMSPDGETLIDYLTQAGVSVQGVGKTASMFNNQGFPEGRSLKLHDDNEKVQETLKRIQRGEPGLTFTNLVSTDEHFGHPRLPTEYVGHVETMGQSIAHMLSSMSRRGLLLVTSDHGNDPTQNQHTNHTRERVPLLAFSPIMKGRIELGVRSSFADVAATIAENYGIQNKLSVGESFLRELVG